MLALVYKYLNDQAPLYLQKLLEYQDLEKETRSSGKRLLKIPKSNEKLSWVDLLQYYIQSKWNKLPVAIRNATTLKDFKKMLDPLFKQAYGS